jgi:methylglyoxal synthase
MEKKRLKIALVAHDARKQELIDWCRFNMDTLLNHDMVATGTTSKLIKEMFMENDYPSEYIGGFDEMKRYYDYKVKSLLSGPLGGDQQIGAMIAQGEIDVLIFFCDNLITQGHQQDVGALSRLASLYNIAFATNRTTADMIISSPLFDDKDYNRIIPTAIESYKNRKL